MSRPTAVHPPNLLFNIYKTLPSLIGGSRWTKILPHIGFHSSWYTLVLSFFLMLCLLAQPVLCFFDPLWSTRHIDFQVYTIKLQPGFCLSCVLQCFLTFEPTLSMMSCLTLQPRLGPERPLWWSRHIDFETSCLLCKSVSEFYKTSSKNVYRFVEL